MVVARCHASSVWRSVDVRRIVRAVLRPRAISIPPSVETMDPCITCERGILFTSSATDSTIVFEKSNIASWKYIPTETPGGPGEKQQVPTYQAPQAKQANGATSIGLLG